VVTTLATVGAQSLEVRTVLTTASVAYASIELADDCELVRLQTFSTNVFALAWAPPQTNGFLVVRPQGTNALRLIPTGLAEESAASLASDRTRAKLGAPVLNDATNLIAVVVTSGRDGFHVVPSSPTRRWAAVQPRDFRQQIGLLAQAEQQSASSRQGVAPDRKRLARQLRETSWPTNFLKTKAVQLANELEL
jgi:hypothetical protein